MNPVMMRGGPGPGGYLHAANGLDQEELQALRFFKGEMSKATRIVDTTTVKHCFGFVVKFCCR
jgi:hypothetical protein